MAPPGGNEIYSEFCHPSRRPRSSPTPLVLSPEQPRQPPGCGRYPVLRVSGRNMYNVIERKSDLLGPGMHPRLDVLIVTARRDWCGVQALLTVQVEDGGRWFDAYCRTSGETILRISRCAGSECCGRWCGREVVPGWVYAAQSSSPRWLPPPSCEPVFTGKEWPGKRPGDYFTFTPICAVGLEIKAPCRGNDFLWPIWVD